MGICSWFFDSCDTNIGEVAIRATRAIENKGANLSEVTSYAVPEAGQIFSQGGLAASEFATLINTEFPDWKETLDPNVKSRFESMANISASDHDDRLQRLKLLAKEIEQVLSDVDVLVGPTVPITPPTIREVAEPHLYRQLIQFPNVGWSVLWASPVAIRFHQIQRMWVSASEMLFLRLYP